MPIEPGSEGASKGDFEKTMGEGLDRIREANENLGRRLFANVELRGGYSPTDYAVMFFPTPLRREITDEKTGTQKGVSEYLVASHEGFQIVQVDNSGSGLNANTVFAEITAQLDKDPDIPVEGGIRAVSSVSPPGLPRLHLKISGVQVNSKGISLGGSGFQDNGRLIEVADGDTALQIITLNRQRAEQISSREQVYLRAQQSSSQIAQRLGEVLGPFS